MGESRPLFVYFRYFLDTISIIQIEKSVDGVLGIRTRGLQDGRRTQNHAMAATHNKMFFLWAQDDVT